MRLGDLPVVFVSYDEPYADKRYDQLQESVPTAHRVHGVDGIVDAYKAAARQVEGDYVVTVDGDTGIDPVLFELTIALLPIETAAVRAWSARNEVNGLVYGNGGVKCWPRKALLALDQIEAVSVTEAVGRIELSMAPYATTYCNDSPFHAFRAGYREGVRLAAKMDNGANPTATYRLSIWCSVGADVDNGKYCVLGARLGALKHAIERLPRSNVQDYRRIESLYKSQVVSLIGDDEKLSQAIEKIGERLRQGMGLEIADLDPAASRLFKKYTVPPVDSGMMDRLANRLRERGGEDDLSLAHDLLMIAASLGNSNALTNLGRIYQLGQHGDKNLELARRFLLEATELGNPFAPYHLGRMYAKGWGIPRDIGAAREFCELSYKRGFSQARELLKDLPLALEDP